MQASDELEFLPDDREPDTRATPLPSGNMAEFQTRLAWSGALAVVASLACLATQKDSRSGTLLSLIGDVLPLLCGCVAIIFGVPCVRARPRIYAAIAVVYLLMATFAISVVLSSMVFFWNRPYARGPLIGL